ncbi:MAG: hypothetical protein K8S15_10160 [Candidatus Aegiribacteria sp.]|nr:hypothetical protein [Candidatus Aegiribacteria sp.]
MKIRFGIIQTGDAREDLQSFLDSGPSSSHKKRMAEQMLERGSDTLIK